MEVVRSAVGAVFALAGGAPIAVGGTSTLSIVVEALGDSAVVVTMGALNLVGHCIEPPFNHSHIAFYISFRSKILLGVQTRSLWLF